MEPISKAIDKAIINFIARQSCATICVVDESNMPHCFNCFYAFNADEIYLYFKSSENTQHISILKRNPNISGTILPNKLNKLHTCGIQFNGVALTSHQTELQQAKRRYYYKHPLAISVQGDLYVIRIDRIKMSERIGGIAKKYKWNRYVEIITRSSNLNTLLH